MELPELERHWNAFGERDPLWAILSSPGKRGGAWDLDEFMATGRSHVMQALDVVRAQGIVVGRERALDFGCGVGRLTQALAEYFERADGVDVAASMIERAEALNPAPERIRFHHNESPDLRLFASGSFDFVLSLIVLQHMEPPLMRAYIGEFVRVLRIGGVAFFNVPDSRPAPTRLEPDAWKAILELRGAVESVAPGVLTSVPIRVHNASPTSWPGSALVRVAGRWSAADGSPLGTDVARIDLGDLAAGAQIDLVLQVTAPAAPGDYLLDVDLLQENVAWFGDHGSEPLRMSVHVNEATVEELSPVATESAPGLEPVAPADAAEFTPQIEMHVMAQDDVVQAVRDVGGEIIAANAGPFSMATHRVIDYVVVAREHRPPAGRVRWATRRTLGKIRRRLG